MLLNPSGIRGVRSGLHETFRERAVADDSKLAEKNFWNQTPQEIRAALPCGLEGLSSGEARQRLDQYGPNSDAAARADSVLRAVLRRLLEPLSLILLAAGIVSILTGDTIGGSIIVLILTLSIGLDTVQEGHAVKTAEILRRSVALKAEVKRDGVFRQIEVDQVVPGDLFRVRAGDIIPADALILDSTALHGRRRGPHRRTIPCRETPGRSPLRRPGDCRTRCFAALWCRPERGDRVLAVGTVGRATVFGAAASALSEAQAPLPVPARDLPEFGLVIARLTLDPGRRRPGDEGACLDGRCLIPSCSPCALAVGLDARTAADDHDRDAVPWRDAHGGGKVIVSALRRSTTSARCRSSAPTRRGRSHRPRSRLRVAPMATAPRSLALPRLVRSPPPSGATAPRSTPLWSVGLDARAAGRLDARRLAGLHFSRRLRLGPGDRAGRARCC